MKKLSFLLLLTFISIVNFAIDPVKKTAISDMSASSIASYKTVLGYQTPAEADAKYQKKNDTISATTIFYTIPQIDAKLLLKANKSITDTIGTNHYNKVQVNAKFATIANTVYKNNIVSEMQQLGINVEAIPFFAYSIASSATFTSVDGTAYLEAVKIQTTKLYTGIGFMMASPTGAYTADNFNGFVIYSLSGNTMTEVARTADTPNLWKATAFTVTYTSFTTPVTLTAGITYIIVGVWNASATTTAPILQGFGTQSKADAWANIPRVHASLATQNTLPSSYTITSFTNDSNIKAFWVY